MYKRIVDGSSDAILFVDRKGEVRLWNKGAENIFGYKKNEVIGKSLDLIIPEKLCRRHREGYFKVMETGATRYGKKLLKVPAIRKDGMQISIEFSITLIKDSKNEMVGTAAIIRDTTEHWQQEKELKKRLAFLEKQFKAKTSDP